VPCEGLWHNVAHAPSCMVQDWDLPRIMNECWNIIIQCPRHGHHSSSMYQFTGREEVEADSTEHGFKNA
jgi:hypothetical protein